MSTTPTRLTTLVRLGLAVTAVAALAACGSATSTPAGTSATTATTGAATSTTGTGTVTPSGTSTPSASHGSTEAAPATPAGVLWEPWTDPRYQVGFLGPAATGTSQSAVAVESGTFVKNTGSDGWSITRTGATRQRELEPNGRFYVSCPLIGKPVPSDGADFCQVSATRLRSIVEAHGPNAPEFWFTLDSGGGINLAYQLYHS